MNARDEVQQIASVPFRERLDVGDRKAILAAVGLNWEAPPPNVRERSQLRRVINFGRPSIQDTTAADKSVTLFWDSIMLFLARASSKISVYLFIHFVGGKATGNIRINALCAGDICFSLLRPRCCGMVMGLPAWVHWCTEVVTVLKKGSKV